MTGGYRFFVLLFSLLLVASFTISCGKKAVVKGESEGIAVSGDVDEEKPTEIKEEVVTIQEKMTEETVVADVDEALAAEEVVMEFSIDDIRFDFDKYFIRDDARPVLEKLGTYLRENRDVKVLIEGNCDERGTPEYNFALGERRAQAAKDYLVNLGIDQSRIKTISYGEERPLDPGHNEDSWAKNRRDHFVILK